MELNLMKGYSTAYKIACEELTRRNHEEISLNANVVYDKGNHIFFVKYLNKEYKVNCLTGEVSLTNSREEVVCATKVLLLHYLLNAQNKPLSGNLVSLKELKGGAAIYYQAFYKRAIAPLIKNFEKNIDGFYRAAVILGSYIEKYGNASVSIRVLPLVPVTYVLWKGDEEVAASGTILFDDSIESFLPAEDIVYAASFGVYELMRLCRGNVL